MAEAFVILDGDWIMQFISYFEQELSSFPACESELRIGLTAPSGPIPIKEKKSSNDAVSLHWSHAIKWRLENIIYNLYLSIIYISILISYITYME